MDRQRAADRRAGRELEVKNSLDFFIQRLWQRSEDNKGGDQPRLLTVNDYGSA